MQSQGQVNNMKSNPMLQHVGSEDVTKQPYLIDIMHIHLITPSVPESYKVPIEINPKQKQPVCKKVRAIMKMFCKTMIRSYHF